MLHFDEMIISPLCTRQHAELDFYSASSRK